MIDSPTEQDVLQILEDALGKKAKVIKRFSTGLANYVYDIKTEDGENLVVRLARPDLKHFFDGALYWYKQLEDIGVPIPKLYYSDISGKHSFPVMIMERLSGVDLAVVYSKLNSEQKKILAGLIVGIQKNVATLPKGKGYGYARSYDDLALHDKWIDVLDENLERSRERIKKAEIFSEEAVDKVKKLIHQYSEYFSLIEPVCFLDDITTKNVIINNGDLSGVVDIDSVAFGDPLLTLALTRMSLLYSGDDTKYTDYWVEILDLNDQQKKTLNLYTAMFCVDFMSEMGQLFNKNEVELPNQKKVKKLNGILSSLIKV